MQLERAWATRPQLRRGFTGALIGGGLALGIVCVPVLPLTTADAQLERYLGFAVAPIELTHDHRSLTPQQRQHAAIVTGNYGQASAINLFGPELDLPRASSGHMK